MNILPWVLMVINPVFTLETEVISYLYLRGKEINVLLLRVLQGFVNGLNSSIIITGS